MKISYFDYSLIFALLVCKGTDIRKKSDESNTKEDSKTRKNEISVR